MNSDRLKTALSAFVRAALPQVDYHAYYPCTVNAQNADGTLELTPESGSVPQQKNVPIRLGIPGAAVKVQAGARVMLSWENGSPTQPFAALWGGPNGAIELKLNAGTFIFNDGAIPVAKEGSATDGHTHSIPAGTDAAGGTTGKSSDKIKTGAGSPTVLVP